MVYHADDVLEKDADCLATILVLCNSQYVPNIHRYSVFISVLVCMTAVCFQMINSSIR